MFKAFFVRIVLLVVLLLSVTLITRAQVSPGLQLNTWKENQLIEPRDLAGLIADHSPVTIYNIGVVQNIKGAINMGAASESENLERLRSALNKVPRNQQIVFYCGCCPMGKCPNIRPALKLFSDLKFSNVSLLNLPDNLKIDWTDKGYPVEQRADGGAIN